MVSAVITLVCGKCSSKDKQIFKEVEESIDILKILGLINNMIENRKTEELICQELRLKNIDKRKLIQ